VVKRGDAWLAALGPTVGTAVHKSRLCVAISPPKMHDYLRTVIVAPMTTGSHPAPFRVPIRFQGKPKLVLLDQVRTLDCTRLVKRLGAASPPTLAKLPQILQGAFAP
jgi:mRNA interferase MazF